MQISTNKPIICQVILEINPLDCLKKSVKIFKFLSCKELFSCLLRLTLPFTKYQIFFPTFVFCFEDN